MKGGLDPALRNAALAYRPKRIRLLLVPECPPAEPGRYFYFETADSMEPLFTAVCGVLFETSEIADKVPYLRELRRRSVFVTELAGAPAASAAESRELAQWLALRLGELAPERVVLIGGATMRTVEKGLAAAGAPVVRGVVPAPGGAGRLECARGLRTALVRAGLENLIRPLSRTRTK